MYPQRRCISAVQNGVLYGLYRVHHYCPVTPVAARHISDSWKVKHVKHSWCHPLIITTATTAPFYAASARCVAKHYLTTSGTDIDSRGGNGALKQQYSYQLLLQHLTHSTRSLGVWEGIEFKYTTAEQNVWESIHELPEIQTVCNALQVIQQIDPSSAISPSSMVVIHTQYNIAITALERAIQIFGSYRPGGKEQIASYALLSEFQNRDNQYDHCHKTLKELLSVYKSNSDDSDDKWLNDIVQIAIAKVHWYQGNHADGKEICDTLVDEDRTVGVIARTGQAVTRLLLVSSLDDVFSVRDPFRMSIKRLERMVNPSATVLAAAHLNMGIVEMVWAETVSKFNDVDAPLDAAMRNWKQGITVLTKGELTSQLKTKSTSKNDSHLRSILHARLLCNMAYGMLHMNQHADYITRSIEYASESLAIYDAMKNNKMKKEEGVESTESLSLIDKEGLGRTLSILGTCYHLHGKAVMAQGLFQSALDKIPVNFSTWSTDATPLQLVEQSDTYDRYADLCSDWDEREGDAKQLRQKADDINAKLLPDGWKDKTSIHGSLWFWTGATIQRH